MTVFFCLEVSLVAAADCVQQQRTGDHADQTEDTQRPVIESGQQGESASHPGGVGEGDEPLEHEVEGEGCPKIAPLHREGRPPVSGRVP